MPIAQETTSTARYPRLIILVLSRPAGGSRRMNTLVRFSWAIVASNVSAAIAAAARPTCAGDLRCAASAQKTSPNALVATVAVISDIALVVSDFRNRGILTQTSSGGCAGIS